MGKNTLALILVAVMAVTTQYASAAEVKIGYVSKKAYRDAKGVRLSGTIENLSYRTDVYSDETVKTVQFSETTLRFLDTTKLQVGPESEVALTKFIYDPDATTGDMVVNFSTGAFRFITGKMTNNEGFNLATPVALIGIRGTDFKLIVAADGATTIAVLEGIVELIPLGGGATAVVAAGQSGSLSSASSNAVISQGDSIGNMPGLLDNPY
jgi:hypothetical protein